jgi:hypothetical protein
MGRRLPHSDEELLDAVRRGAERIGRSPSVAMWLSQPDRPCSEKVLIHRFGGGWLAVLEAAGLEPTKDGRESQWTNEHLLSMLRAYATAAGAPPTGAGWNVAYPEGPDERTVARRFGSWGAALEAAGLQRRPRARSDAMWTPDSVIESIQRWAEQHGGEPPTANAWRQGQGDVADHPSYRTVRDLFGTWNEGIKAAGFTPRDSGGQKGPQKQQLDSARQMVTGGHRGAKQRGFGERLDGLGDRQLK